MKYKRQEYKQLYEYLSVKRGIEQLESITSHDMKAYIKTKHNANLKPQSIISMAKMVAAFFNWYVSEEYITESPMKGVALPKVAKQIHDGFTSDEAVSMIDASNYKDYINARNKAIVAMLIDTGLRAIEITNLPSDAVKNINMLVIGKGRKERIVYISPAFRQILIKYERIKREYFKDKPVKSDAYFLNYKGEEMSHIGLWKVAKLAGELAGVQDVKDTYYRGCLYT